MQPLACHDGASRELFASHRSAGPLDRLTDRTSVNNKLLLGLEERDFQHIAPLLRRVPLRTRQILVEPNMPVREVYFIERGIAAVISRSKHKPPMEVSMIGCFGMAGLPAALGTNRSPFRCVVQVPGIALRMSAVDLQLSMEQVPGLRQQLMNYVQALMVQQAQITVCNTRHRVKERIARWLLLALDRMEDDPIPVTHELIGRMLGIRRAGVTTVISEMEASGLLCHGRGYVRILDRSRLEQSACDCYGMIKREFDRLIVHPYGRLHADSSSKTFADLGECSAPGYGHLRVPL